MVLLLEVVCLNADVTDVCLKAGHAFTNADVTRKLDIIGLQNETIMMMIIIIMKAQQNENDKLADSKSVSNAYNACMI